MWSQIIFFAAVALVIIVLLRHSVIARSTTGKRTGGWSGLKMYKPQFRGGMIHDMTSTISGWFSKISSFNKRPKKLASTPVITSAEVKTVPTNATQDHTFWKEEAATEMSLGSNFEEGEALYKAGKFTEAEQFFVKSAANHPNDPKIYARLGLLYLQLKNYSDAIEALKVASKLDKHNPSRYYNLALAYSGNKDSRKAIAAAREAISLDPVTEKYRKLLEKLLNE